MGGLWLVEGTLEESRHLAGPSSSAAPETPDAAYLDNIGTELAASVLACEETRVSADYPSASQIPRPGEPSAGMPTIQLTVLKSDTLKSD
jgi:hypothetical protein